jgi:hypothetical protein
MPKQSDYIRKLYQDYLEAAREAVIAKYADAEKSGAVNRDKDAYGLAPEEYARKLWRNGWRSDGGKKPHLLETLQQYTANPRFSK